MVQDIDAKGQELKDGQRNFLKIFQFPDVVNLAALALRFQRYTVVPHPISPTNMYYGTYEMKDFS